VVAAVAAVVVLVAACAPPVGRVALRQVPNTPQVWDNSDPAVLVDGGALYLFGSTNNKKLPVRRADLSQPLAQTKSSWDAAAGTATANEAMRVRPGWVNPTRHNGTWQIWAPAAVEIGGTYWVYFAASRGGATDLANDQCIGRARATSPMGPYTPMNNPLFCGLAREAGSNSWGRGALDPEVFRAPDGRLYLLVTLSRTHDNIAVVPLAADGSVPGGVNASATVLASQAFDWHDGYDGTTPAGRRPFLENPSMVHEPVTNTYLLFYSAGQWYQRNYLTGFARCASPTGPCTSDPRGPFLKSGNGRSGPGGLTAFRGPDGIPRVAYASWPDTGPGSAPRHTHWSRLIIGTTSDPADQTISLG
jgi:hypothetical protein